MTWANCWLTVQPTAPTTIKDRTTTIKVENMRPKCMRSRSLATGVRIKVMRTARVKGIKTTRAK